MPTNLYYYLSVLVSLTHQQVIFFLSNLTTIISHRRVLATDFFRHLKGSRPKTVLFLSIHWLMEIYSHVVMVVTEKRKRRNNEWSFILSKRCCLCPCSNLLWISRSRQHLIVVITMISP